MSTPAATRRGIRPMKDMISVVLTIDTEPDDAWKNHLDPSVANVQELRRLQELLDKYGAKVTCLVTYRVIQNEAAVAVLRELVEKGGAEIGAHLHPWETPPFMESGLDIQYAIYPHELPLHIFAQKLERLTEAITERFGRPTAYRAGRWGFIAEHVPILERLGYEVDTSVIPLVDWRGTPGVPRERGGTGGIDYRFAPQQIYHPSYSDVRQPGNARIVELPVSVGFTRHVPAFVQRTHTLLPAVLHRVLRKSEILRVVRATPPSESNAHLTMMLATAITKGVSQINIALHSSELMLNGSPKSRTNAQIQETLAKIESVLEMLVNSGASEFTTLTEASRKWQARRMVEREEAQSGRRARITDGRNHRTASGMHSSRELVYILSSSFSGSTLLTFLLGTHPDIATVGELKATSMGDIEQYVCSCGTRIRECPFWRAVEQRMEQRGVQFDVAEFGTHFVTDSRRMSDVLCGTRVRGHVFERGRRIGIQLWPGSRGARDRILSQNRFLTDVISAVQEADMFLDGSKDAVRLLHLFESGQWNVKVISLIRDGLGTSNSYMKHLKVPMQVAAREWRQTCEEGELVLRRMPASSWARLHYEDLCRDPDKALETLFGFLGLDPGLATRDFRSVEHHILGNYMRLASRSEITVDESWRTQLTPHDLEVFDQTAGDSNRQLGYAR